MPTNIFCVITQFARTGRASGAMCSYTGVNGSPMCANGKILNGILRNPQRWNRSDALITTDCGAIGMMQHQPANASAPEVAAAWALNNGTDIEMGDQLYATKLPTAISKGLTSYDTVKESVRRSLRLQFSVGRFDSIGNNQSNPWAHIPLDVVNSTEHQQVLHEAALQSYVLLKNNGALPLRMGSKVAVLGPQAFSRGLFGDYSNSPCSSDDKDCTRTIAEGIAQVNVGGTTSSAFGVDVTIPINATNSSSCDKPIYQPHDLNASSNHGDKCIPEALALVDSADAVVLALGIDGNIEHENVDRPDTAPPGLQTPFAQRVLSKAATVGKPVILVMAGIGTLAIDDLMSSSGGPAAIVEAFAPGHTAVALAESLFGVHNRWGKMPVTVYPHSYIKEQPMTNYDMAAPPGRTYKYYRGRALFKFGEGLSYTNFSLTCRATGSLAPPLTASCDVTNTGDRTGDEVVMVYHVAGAAVRAAATKTHPVPLRSLVGFERVTLGAGTTQTIHFPPFERKSFELVNADGNRTLYPGEHSLVFSRGHGAEVAVNVTL